MLSLSSKNYTLPLYNAEFQSWCAVDRNNNTLLSNNFQYTYLFGYRLKGEDQSVCHVARMTFLYGANQSVKPHGRTLRILGKDKSARVVSALSRLNSQSSAEQVKQAEALVEKLMVRIIIHDNHLESEHQSE